MSYCRGGSEWVGTSVYFIIHTGQGVVSKIYFICYILCFSRKEKILMINANTSKT